jgi:hypothetical protein
MRFGCGENESSESERPVGATTLERMNKNRTRVTKYWVLFSLIMLPINNEITQETANESLINFWER